MANSLAKTERPSTRAWVLGIAAWLVPGSGHCAQGHWKRGLLLGGVVTTAFLVGLYWGGNLFVPANADTASGPLGTLWPVLPAVANLGNGVLYLFCALAHISTDNGAQLARLSTFEYGQRFLLLSGLLNYLVALDAFDIAAGRK